MFQALIPTDTPRPLQNSMNSASRPTLSNPTNPLLTHPPAGSSPQRLLDYIRPDRVHVMQDGRIVTTGDMGLVEALELEGYKVLEEAPPAPAAAV